MQGYQHDANKTADVVCRLYDVLVRISTVLFFWPTLVKYLVGCIANRQELNSLKFYLGIHLLYSVYSVTEFPCDQNKLGGPASTAVIRHKLVVGGPLGRRTALARMHDRPNQAFDKAACSLPYNVWFRDYDYKLFLFHRTCRDSGMSRLRRNGARPRLKCTRKAEMPYGRLRSCH